jgi:hypothetical protein
MGPEKYGGLFEHHRCGCVVGGAFDGSETDAPQVARANNPCTSGNLQPNRARVIAPWKGDTWTGDRGLFFGDANLHSTSTHRVADLLWVSGTVVCVPRNGTTKELATVR